MNIEKYKNRWNETIDKLKVSEFGDWFKGYFYIFIILIALGFVPVTLILIFSGKVSGKDGDPFVTLGKGVSPLFFISLIVALVISAVWALISVVFFRYIPRISVLYLMIYSGFLGFSATQGISNSLYKNQNFIVPTHFLVIIFLVFYFLIILAHYLVIKIVIKNVNKRSSQT